MVFFLNKLLNKKFVETAVNWEARSNLATTGFNSECITIASCLAMTKSVNPIDLKVVPNDDNQFRNTLYSPLFFVKSLLALH